MGSLREKRKLEKKLEETLKDVFGLDKYLDLQEEASLRIFEAKRDVFISGLGKSLCYQLPVLVKDNVFIIVITSSISYMKRYQEFFKTKNIKTDCLTSNLSRKRRMSIEKDILSETSTLKMLFITPLKYESAYWKTLLKKIKKHRLFYIVVDQSDNIIAEHESIRRQYENLDLKIIKVPIVAISGTADSQVHQDIIRKLNLRNPKVYAMPASRPKVFHDTWYINTLPDPVVHLREFIGKCLVTTDNNMNSVEKDTWGVIVCKDTENAISIAKYLLSVGIPALPYTSRNKDKQLKNFKDVKVITISAQVHMFTVTNRLVQMIARKLVRFVVYWGSLPNLEKHYLQMVQGDRFGMSFCRIYFQLEELLLDNAQSSNCHDKSSSNELSSSSRDESSSKIKTSLIQIECRYKVYSKYCDNTSSACGIYCDVCKDRKEVEEKIDALLQLADNEYLKKLREALELSTNSGGVCQHQTKNIESKETRKCNDDHPGLDPRIQNVEKHNDKLYQKSQSSSKSSKVSREYEIVNIESETTKKKNAKHPSLDTDTQCLEKNDKLNKKTQALSKSSKAKATKTINIESEATKEINDNQSQLDAIIQRIEEDNDELDKKAKAGLALDEIYKNLFGTQKATSSLTLAPTQPFNYKSISSTTKGSVKKSKKSKTRNRETETETTEVITIDDETNEREEGIVQNEISQLGTVKKSKKSKTRNRETETETTEVITIDDETNEREEGFVQDEISQLRENVPNNNDDDDDDDDIICIKESRKRKKSQDSTSKRKKRRE